MKNIEKEHIEEIERANDMRSFNRAKYYKCLRCTTIQIVDDVKCPNCGSYDLTEVYLSTKELIDLADS